MSKGTSSFERDRIAEAVKWLQGEPTVADIKTAIELLISTLEWRDAGVACSQARHRESKQVSDPVLRTYRTPYGTEFRVLQAPNGHLCCTCKGYRESWSTPKTCRHIKQHNAEPCPFTTLDWISEASK